MSKGIVIVIDGTDSSGKETQANLLYEYLKNNNIKTRKLSYPNYENNFSMFATMYLKEEFGTSVDDVNAYAASTFYAIERFASYRTDWMKDYLDGAVIICDRYVSSNMIHQTCKIVGSEYEEQKFLEWLLDLEYNIYGIPKPDMTILLDMPRWAANKLMENRKNKIDGKSQKDIHEKNLEYLEKSYAMAKKISESYNWEIVNCTKSDEIKTPQQIHQELVDLFKLNF